MDYKIIAHNVEEIDYQLIVRALKVNMMMESRYYVKIALINVLHVYKQHKPVLHVEVTEGKDKMHLTLQIAHVRMENMTIR